MSAQEPGQLRQYKKAAGCIPGRGKGTLSSPRRPGGLYGPAAKDTGAISYGSKAAGE
jgi:hypothetical protein